MKKSPIFEKTYRAYLAQIGQLDLEEIADKLGITTAHDEAVVPFFATPYRVSADGISDPSGKKPPVAVSVILCKYLLMCPEYEPRENQWVSYKDFKDAAPLVGAFDNTIQKPICETFSGRLAELEKAGRQIGGLPPAEEFSYDLSMQFEALPKVPLLLLFNDKDEEFPAQSSVLFERRAERYLDMECLAMVGMLLCEYLKARQRAREGHNPGTM